MALSISYSNIPHAFGHIMELSQLPTHSTYDVIFNNKTIDQVVDTPTTEYDEMDWFEGDDMLGDPDALDKVKYQAENPNAIMTPWGPTLTPEAVDAIISDSPGVQELLGLTDEEIEEVTASADAIINASGDNLDSIIDQANTTAMSENLDPNDVAVGIVDYMANQPAPGQNDQVWSTGSWLDDAPLSTSDWFASASEVSDDYTPTGDEGFPSSTSDWFTSSDDGDAKQGATNEYLDGLLDLSDSDILSEIDEALKDWLPAESLTSWAQSHPEWSSKTSPRYNLGQAAVALASGKDYEDFLQSTTEQDESQLTTMSDTGTIPDESQPYTEYKDVQAALNQQELSSLMKGAFIEALNKQPHPQYKGYTFGGILNESQKLDRYNEANVVFWLDRESDNGASSETIASEFATFLNKYWNDPEAHAEYTDRAKLLEKAQKLALYFDDPEEAQTGEKDVGGTYASYADAYFGEGFDSNRRILLKLIRSGRSFGDHPANRYVDSKITSDNNWGKNWQVSFSEMVDNMPQPTARTQTQQNDYFTEDDSPTTSIPLVGEDMGVSMLGYGPEYYGTGNPFGTPDITMGMLRPEPVGGTDEWIITPSGRLYNPNAGVWEDEDDFRQRIERGGRVPSKETVSQDYMDSLGEEFYGEGYTFGPSSPTTYVDPDDRGVGSYYDQFQPTDAVKQVPVEDWWAGSQEIDFTDPAIRAAASNLQGIEAPAFEDLSTEMLLSMPEPFDEEENEKRMAGRPYSTVLKIGGVIQRDEAGNPIRGTNFVPTNRWVPSR